MDIEKLEQRDLVEKIETLNTSIEERMAKIESLKPDEVTALDADVKLFERCNAERESREATAATKNSLRDNWLQKRTGGSGTETNPRAPDLQLNQRNRRDPVENPDGARYSLCRAMLAIWDGHQVKGYEAECSQELRKRYPTPAGVMTRDSPVSVPWTLPVDYRMAQRYARQNGLSEQRALNLSAGAGGLWAQQEVSMIDLLRAKNGIMKLGCTFFSNVTGNSIVIPKQTAGTTAYWLAEAGAPTASNLTTGTVTVAPKTCSAYTDITRSLLVQQSIDFENFARNELLTTVSIAIDSAGFNGTGSSNQPTGMLADSSIATVALGTNGAAPSYGKIVEMESTVQTENYDSENFRYVGSSKVSAVLKTTLIGSNTAALYLLKDGILNECPFYRTNLIPDNLEKGSGTGLSAMIYGDWAQYIIALWSGLDLIVDPYALSTSGGKRIVALQDIGMKPRQPKAFNKIVDMITTLS